MEVPSEVSIRFIPTDRLMVWASMLVRWRGEARWEAHSLAFFMASAVLAAGLLVISIPAAAVVLRLGSLGGWGQTPGCLLVAGLAAVEGGLGVHLISSMDDQIDVASIPVTDGVSVAAPVRHRVAGCLCGISVGQD